MFRNVRFRGIVKVVKKPSKLWIGQKFLICIDIIKGIWYFIGDISEDGHIKGLYVLVIAGVRRMVSRTKI